jgi:hypothetical protein
MSRSAVVLSANALVAAAAVVLVSRLSAVELLGGRLMLELSPPWLWSRVRVELPQDVAVVGFDDHASASLLDLSTCASP